VAAANDPVDACVEKRNFLKCVGVSAVGYAAIERFGIDMDADRTLVEFGKVQYLMDRLFEFDLGCETIG
jgi:hypothetical protein